MLLLVVLSIIVIQVIVVTSFVRVGLIMGHILAIALSLAMVLSMASEYVVVGFCYLGFIEIFGSGDDPCSLDQLLRVGFNKEGS